MPFFLDDIVTMKFKANVFNGIVTLTEAYCKCFLNSFEKGTGLRKFTVISQLMVLFVILSAIRVFGSDAFVPESPISGIGSELSVRNVALEMMNVGIEQYNRALFDASEKTLLKAQQFKKYLTEAEIGTLTRYLRKATVAAVKRKGAIEDLRQADKLLKENQFLRAKAHLVNISTSELLTPLESEVVRKGLEIINKNLAEQDKQYLDIYQQSVLLYEQGQLEAARAGFIRVTLYGLLVLPLDRMPEQYIEKIDGVLGKAVSPLMTTEGLFSQSFQPIFAPDGSLLGDRARYKTFPGTGTQLRAEEAPAMNPARKSLVQSYVNAVVTSSIAKAREHIKSGKFYLAQNQIETAKKAIGDNLSFLEKDIVERYDSQLKEIQAQINDGIAKAFGSAQIDSAIDP